MCCLPFLGAPWGDSCPPRASLLEHTELTAGTALREVCITTGETESCKIYSCSAPRSVPTATAWQGQQWPRPLGNHQPPSSRTPGMSPAAVSRCPFYLNALAPSVLQACNSTAITLALPSEGNIIPASPCLQQLPPPAPAEQAQQPAPREGGSQPRRANGRKIKLGVCRQACCSCSRTHILLAVQNKRVFSPLS